MEIVSINRVKARRPHKCDMCGKNIEVGEEYEAQNLVYYNEMYTFHQCDRCKPYVDELWSIGFDGYYSDGLDPDTSKSLCGTNTAMSFVSGMDGIWMMISYE